MSKKTESQEIVKRNQLKRLSVNISMTSKSGYTSKAIFNSRKLPILKTDHPMVKKGLLDDEILLRAIEELAFIAYFNVSSLEVIDAITRGMNRASYVVVDSEVPF